MNKQALDSSALMQPSLSPSTTLGLETQRSKEGEEISNVVKFKNGNKLNERTAKDIDILGDTQIKKDKTPLLPIDGMPPFIQEYITTCSSVYNTPRDYWAGSAIMATALAIGDKIELQTKYQNVPILWMNIIGGVSSGKTEAMSQPFKPFEKLDSKSIETFKAEYKKYDLIEKMTVKERITAGVFKIQEPSCFQYIVNDSTPEALCMVHTANTRGIMILRDELKGWIDDFNRYSQSGFQSTMLSSYSRVGMTINRKSGGANSVLSIPKPCILVLGGMQPELIPTLKADNRADNGFLSRICNVWPDDKGKPAYSTKTVPVGLVKRWNDYIVGLTVIPQPENITLSVEAETFYQEWYNRNSHASDSENSGYLKGVYGKFDIIALRLAVVIYGMGLLNGRIDNKEITGDEMNTAVNITEYFRVTALKVYHKLFDNSNTLNNKEVIKFLSGLGNSQSKIAEVIGVKQPYVSKVLN